MKTTVKVAVISVLLIVGAWLFYKGARIAMGTDTESVIVNTYQEKMLIAKEAFLEKPDNIQYLALDLMEKTGLTILSDSEGKPVAETETGLQTPSEVLEAEAVGRLEDVMGAYSNGARVYNIKVTDKAVLFYTDYSADGGCCGFLYEIEDNSTDYYQYIELVEGNSEETSLGRWLIFYHLPNE